MATLAQKVYEEFQQISPNAPSSFWSTFTSDLQHLSLEIQGNVGSSYTNYALWRALNEISPKGTSTSIIEALTSGTSQLKSIILEIQSSFPDVFNYIMGKLQALANNAPEFATPDTGSLLLDLFEVLASANQMNRLSGSADFSYLMNNAILELYSKASQSESIEGRIIADILTVASFDGAGNPILGANGNLNPTTLDNIINDANMIPVTTALRTSIDTLYHKETEVGSIYRYCTYLLRWYQNLQNQSYRNSFSNAMASVYKNAFYTLLQRLETDSTFNPGALLVQTFMQNVDGYTAPLSSCLTQQDPCSCMNNFPQKLRTYFYHLLDMADTSNSEGSSLNQAISILFDSWPLHTFQEQTSAVFIMIIPMASQFLTQIAKDTSPLAKQINTFLTTVPIDNMTFSTAIASNTKVGSYFQSLASNPSEANQIRGLLNLYARG